MAIMPGQIHNGKEDFASLFNFLPIGAYRSDAQGRMVRANPALIALNGYTNEPEMLHNVNLVDSDWYVAPQRRAEFLQQLRRDGFVKGFVSEICRPDTGKHLWVTENAHQVRDAQGEVAYYEGTVEDITERVEAQQAVERSQKQLSQITGQIPGMVYEVHLSPQGERSYRYVSPGIRDIYGLTPQALMDNPDLLSRYRHPDDLGVLQRDLQRAQNAPVTLGGEFRIVMPSGQVKWLLRHSCAMPSDEPGQLRVGVLLDITARKEAEAALLESEALWKLAMESAGDGVWDWNLVTGEEYLSDRILAMFGDAQVGAFQSAAMLDARTHPDDLPQMLIDRAAHFERRVPVYRNEHRIRCADGQWKWVLSRGMVIARDDEGKPLRMVGTHADITELKQAEEQRHQLEVQLREAQKLEAMGTLAGGVAHDFNNLLAVILGNLALAREDVGPGHLAQESLSEITKAAVRARHLVQQILTFSRRQAHELKRQPLQPLVADTVAMMRSVLPANVKPTVDMPEALVWVLADATQIQQVLMNLCTNAWQAMADAPGHIRVAVRLLSVDAALSQRLGGMALGACVGMSVSDDGPGMDQATQERIFEPFFTTKAPGAGTGLGLAVVHGIVKAHHGAMDVHSVLGEGTCFEVVLPLARPLDGVETAAMPASAPPSHAASGRRGRHVVYIDDYEAMVFLVGRLLRKQGYEVSLFTSGDEAMAWLRTEAGAVDIVVTDQNMPGMSGIEVASEVRRLRPGLRTVLITGHLNDGLLAQAQAVGVHKVMGKQDSMAELGEAIEKMLETLLP